MLDMAVAVVMGLAMQAPECVTPPSRASDSYWTYIEACGCARLDAPSGASSDHDRFLAACSAWRQRNPEITVTVPGVPVPSPSPSTPPRECGIPPSRASDSFWSYLEACGCGQVQAPSAASPDHERFLKACGQWRESNPRVQVIVSPSPSPRASARPSPSPSPRRGGL